MQIRAERAERPWGRIITVSRQTEKVERAVLFWGPMTLILDDQRKEIRTVSLDQVWSILKNVPGSTRCGDCQTIRQWMAQILVLSKVADCQPIPQVHSTHDNLWELAKATEVNPNLAPFWPDAYLIGIDQSLSGKKRIIDVDEAHLAKMASCDRLLL